MAIFETALRQVQRKLLHDLALREARVRIEPHLFTSTACWLPRLRLDHKEQPANVAPDAPAVKLIAHPGTDVAYYRPMQKYFSKIGAGLCASLIISFSFAQFAPVNAAAAQAEPTSAESAYIEPGLSRDAQSRRDAARETALRQAAKGTDAGATIEAAAVTAPTVFEKKVSGLTTYNNLSQQASDTSGRVFLGWNDSRNGGSGAFYFSRSLDQGETWSTAKRLDRSSGTGTVTFIDLVTDGFCTVYAGWGDTRDKAAGQVFVSVSRDCGETWSTAEKLSSASSLQDFSFDMAARPNGTVFVTWGDDRNDPVGLPLLTEVYSIGSTDYGTTWQSPKKISDPAPALFDDYGPVTTFADNGDLLVGWLSNRAAGSGYDFYQARSSNMGLTWTADARMNNETAGSQTISAYGLCADNDHVYAAYENSAFPATVFDVKVRASHDFGTTFDAPINTNGSIDADGDQMTLGCAGDRAVVAFGGGTAGSGLDDVRAATTADGGHTWGSAKKVDLGDASDSGNSPLDITSSITPRGDTVVAFTEVRGASTEGFFNYSDDGGTTWQSTDTDFTGGSGTHAVFLSRELGLMLSTPLDGEGASDDGDLHGWLTYYDSRTAAPGMYSARLSFARANETLERLAGATRIETALAISQDSYPIANTATAMVVATSGNFPDGLAGGPLAVMVGGPLLITPTDSLSDDVALEIDRLFDGQDDPETDVFILGGGAAISPAVETAIAGIDAKLDIKRLEGPDRIGTALAVANQLNEIRGNSPTEAILAYSRNFPDALSASAVAASSAINPGLMPILLTDQASLDGRVAAWLTDNAGTGTLTTLNVIGGTAVISDATLAAAGSIVTTVTRFGGVNRYDTAAILNRAMFTGPTAPTTIGVASGEKFPDALTGGAHSGRLNRPLVLVQQNNIPDESMTYVSDNDGTITAGSIYGGTAAISDLVASVMQALY